jgi:hypothetical protein
LFFFSYAKRSVTICKVKRKHASQNREIIHKNSELMRCVSLLRVVLDFLFLNPSRTRANAEANRKLREMQSELMSLKAENLRLSGQNFQLDMQVTSLKEALKREKERGGGSGGISAERLELLRHALDQALLGLHSAQIYAAPSSLPSSPETTPPAKHSSARIGQTAPSPSTGREKPPRRHTFSACPELSFISEVSVDGDDKASTESRYVVFVVCARIGISHRIYLSMKVKQQRPCRHTHGSSFSSPALSI